MLDIAHALAFRRILTFSLELHNGNWFTSIEEDMRLNEVRNSYPSRNSQTALRNTKYSSILGQNQKSANLIHMYVILSILFNQFF